ncbi:hypothetical protein OPT61_g5981 [Boeremia exigua]|uniref:Uncharacterized protein n=1 Tax=Boeremia exigua TaxID=749465 RepID=A0ACC2I8C0_9PLEO|nr:hypothetical protein OPT61_g5981 [Boeremia exigua]
MASRPDEQSDCQADTTSDQWRKTTRSGEAAPTSASDTNEMSEHRGGKIVTPASKWVKEWSSALYANVPIKSKEIRLIELQPSDDAADIRCKLQSYALEPVAPTYVALSYRWGGKNADCFIKVNEESVCVGRNLWMFLREMRRRCFSKKIWIDALCINQKDATERSQQVQMMRQIYTSARSVCVWLGEADALIDAAMDFMTTYKSLTQQLRRARIADISKLTAKTGYYFWTKQIAKAMLSFSSNTYWTRVWIIQEFILAKEISICSGTREVDWQLFNQVIVEVDNLRKNGRPGCVPLLTRFLSSPAVKITKTRKNIGPQLRPLVDLLLDFKDQQATDPCDKIYALLGLAVEGAKISVDYHASTEDLLMQVVERACRSDLRPHAPSKRWHNVEITRLAHLLAAMLRIHCPAGRVKHHVEATEHLRG